MTGRVRLGRDVVMVSESADGVELEGPARLRPGHAVELAPDARACEPAPCRRVLVWTWSLTKLGSDGPLFRGFCRWEDTGGNALPG